VVVSVFFSFFLKKIVLFEMVAKVAPRAQATALHFLSVPHGGCGGVGLGTDAHAQR
jgi:hypothetical protein